MLVLWMLVARMLMPPGDMNAGAMNAGAMDASGTDADAMDAGDMNLLWILNNITEECPGAYPIKKTHPDDNKLYCFKENEDGEPMTYN